jgi:hypothetical protein
MNGGNGHGGNGSAREKPVHVVRYGTIKGAIWRNVVDNGNASRPMYNVTFTRSYKDGEDWRDSQSFGLDDLLVLAKAANDCHTWIYEQRSRDASEAA